MQYDHILIRYGELSLKGKNRKRFVERLKRNLKMKLRSFENLQIEKGRDRMFILLNGDDHDLVIEKMKDVFGIQSFSLALKTENTIEAIQEGALYAFRESGDVKTFKVTAKRSDKSFPKDSQEMNYTIGSYVLRNCDDIKVDVHNPDVNIRVEIRHDATYITCKDYAGAGGLPVGSSGRTMLMLSGGIDSPVAGYLAMKRGLTIEAVHFHSPPFTSERAKQKVMDLAQKLTRYGHHVRLHVVPFTETQKAIHKHIPENLSMTIMRRMMLRITEQLAHKNEALSITTGESLGQVASQTLESMYAINEVTNMPIIRPLVTMDKLEIIDISHKIDTYDISIRPYEDCCTVFLPAAPKTKPKRKHANRFEQYIDVEQLVEDAVEKVELIELHPVHEDKKVNQEFEDLF
jgi:tRNA uracil 4-sulfurtransferase